MNNKMNKIPRRLRKSVDMTIDEMYNRADDLLIKSQRSKRKDYKEMYEKNADSIIQEFHEWFECYHNDEKPEGFLCISVSDCE